MKTENKLPTACIYIDQNNIFFRYKKLDFGKLLKELKKEYDVIRAVSYMALDKNADSQKKFITYLSNNGYRCETLDLSDDTNIDHILIPNLVNDFQRLKPKNIILLSGDAHFSYALNLLSQQGARTTVIGARNFIAYELLKVCDDVKYLEDYDGIILDSGN